MIMVGLVAGCKKGLAVSANPLKSGRDDWIRTSGPLLPNPTHCGRWRGAGLIPS